MCHLTVESDYSDSLLDATLYLVIFSFQQAHLASLQKEVPVKAAVGGKHVKKTVKKKDDTNSGSGGAAASGSGASVSGTRSIPPLID